MGNGMDKIVEGLYIGSIRDAKNDEQLTENKITHVLSIHENATHARLDIKYLCISARDNNTQDLSQYFEETNNFIHRGRLANGNVLVHCLAGVSRSVTVAVAYLMSVTKLGWRDCLNAVRGARRAANPNFGFQRQLVAFEHDMLPQERTRLECKFGANPFPDTEECRDLLEKHRQWVLHGDQVTKLGEQNIYPLTHRAYSKHTVVPEVVPQQEPQLVPQLVPQQGPPPGALDQKELHLERYMNIKEGRDAEQYFRQEEDRALTSELVARRRNSQSAAKSAQPADAADEGSTGGATGGAPGRAPGTSRSSPAGPGTADADSLETSGAVVVVSPSNIEAMFES